CHSGKQYEKQRKHLSAPPRSCLQKLRAPIEYTRPLNRRGHDDVDDRERDQELPAKTHQLIETKAWQRSAQPDVEKKNQHHLTAEVEDAQPRQLMHRRPVPSTKKERRR